MSHTSPAETPPRDGVHAMVPRDRMAPHVRKMRDFVERKPGAPLLQREFGYYCMERWREQGLPENANLAEEFGFDPPAGQGIGKLGWCEAAFCPGFEEKVLETRGDECEVAQDSAGRKVLFFKGRRSGFMPEYVDHPVKDMKTWEENCLWRLDPTTPERWEGFDEHVARLKAGAAQGLYTTSSLVGPYMYLRSLIGPADVLYKFYDMPEVIHACMQAWLKLADYVLERYQHHISLDEIFFAEDICYNAGILISPDMMREFLFPYYQQLLTNVRARQIDKQRTLNLHIDTDGRATDSIPVYRELGMTRMSPFEVASGCDVVAIGREYPDLIMSGGIDKRILSAGKAAIDREVERILPVMRERGGYYPTCDHGVPEEVPLEDYRHYRKRCLELGG